MSTSKCHKLTHNLFQLKFLLLCTYLLQLKTAKCLGILDTLPDLVTVECFGSGLMGSGMDQGGFDTFGISTLGSSGGTNWASGEQGLRWCSVIGLSGVFGFRVLGGGGGFSSMSGRTGRNMLFS